MSFAMETYPNIDDCIIELWWGPPLDQRCPECGGIYSDTNFPIFPFTTLDDLVGEMEGNLDGRETKACTIYYVFTYLMGSNRIYYSYRYVFAG